MRLRDQPTKNQPRHQWRIIDTGPKHVCVSMMHRDTRKEVPRLAQAGVLAQREGGILAQIRGPRCITRCTLRTPCGPCRSPSAASSRSAACCPARAWRERGEESSLVSLRINNLRKTSVSESTAGVARLRLVSDPSSRLLELPMVVGWPPLYRSLEWTRRAPTAPHQVMWQTNINAKRALLQTTTSVARYVPGRTAAQTHVAVRRWHRERASVLAAPGHASRDKSLRKSVEPENSKFGSVQQTLACEVLEAKTPSPAPRTSCP